MSAATHTVKEFSMRNRKIWLGMLVMVLVFGMIVVGCGASGGIGQNSTNVRWEYTYITVTSRDTQSPIERANLLGQEGWELVAAGGPGGNGYYDLYFK